MRTETILVNGGEPVEIEVRATGHGPLVSEALEGNYIGTWFDPNPEPAAPAATGPIRTAGLGMAPIN